MREHQISSIESKTISEWIMNILSAQLSNVTESIFKSHDPSFWLIHFLFVLNPVWLTAAPAAQLSSTLWRRYRKFMFPCVCAQCHMIIRQSDRHKDNQKKFLGWNNMTRKPVGFQSFQFLHLSRYECGITSWLSRLRCCPPCQTLLFPAGHYSSPKEILTEDDTTSLCLE